MTQIVVELVVFTLHEGSLWVAAKPQGNGLQLPREEWTGNGTLQHKASAVAHTVIRYGMMRPYFVSNSELSAPEVGLSVSYIVCAARSVIGADIHLVPIKTERREEDLRFYVEPGQAAQLEKRVRGVVYSAGEWLKTNLSELPLVPAMLEGKFTLTQMQDAVELVTGLSPDKRHFRRQTQESDWLLPTGEKEFGAHRPAMLYRLARSF